MATKKKARSRRSSKKRATSSKRKVSTVLKGRPVQLRVNPDATPEDVEEAAHFARVLDRNQQIAHGDALTPGTTHQIEKDADGKDTLVRKRFSSI